MSQENQEFSGGVMLFSRIGAVFSLLGLLITALGWGALDLAHPALTAIGVLSAIGAAVWVYVDFPTLAGTLSSRGGRSGFGSIVGTLLVAGILVTINVIGQNYERSYDLTRNQVHSLASQSVEVASALERPVSIIAYFRRDPAAVAEGLDPALVRRLVRRYQEHTDALSLELVDPQAQPLRARADQVQQNATIILRSQGPDGSPREERISGVRESDLTNALVRLGRATPRSITFLSGHGEHGIEDSGPDGDSDLAGRLRLQGYGVGEHSLLRDPEGVLDTDVLVIAGPQTAIGEGELDRITNALDEGASLLILLDPERPHGLEGLLAEAGMEAGTDLVLDRAAQATLGDGTAVLVDGNPSHPITRELRLPVVLPMARSIDWLGGSPEGLPEDMRVVPILESTEHAWGETDLTGFEHRFDEDTDREGPLALGMATTYLSPEVGAEEGESEGPHVVVIGDSDFASNGQAKLWSNGDLFLNSINFLAAEEDLIALRPREAAGAPLALSLAQMAVAFLLSLIIIPGFCVAGAATRFFLRRR